MEGISLITLAYTLSSLVMFILYEGLQIWIVYSKCWETGKFYKLSKIYLFL